MLRSGSQAVTARCKPEAGLSFYLLATNTVFKIFFIVFRWFNMEAQFNCPTHTFIFFQNRKQRSAGLFNSYIDFFTVHPNFQNVYSTTS